MEKKPLIIVKIGGSAITAKDDNRPEVNQKNLNRLASELSEAYQKSPFLLYVIHGAGSFGHVPADKYDLNSRTEKQKPPQA